MQNRLFILFALLTLTGTSLVAQMGNGGKQIVNAREFAWKEIGTKNFDIHYYADDPLLAIQVGKYAEEALVGVSRLLDYSHKERFAIWIYSHEYDLIRSNQYGRDERKRYGVTPLLNNSGTIVYPGSMSKLRAEVRSEVVHLLLKEFYYGGGVQISIQNQVLLHTPDWFVQGFSDFVGEGWSFEDEMYVASLSHENLVNYALEGDGHINRATRKSIWFYIAKQYGAEKLSEIFYMTRLTRSVEGGVITVLGITLKTLTERWREFMLARISANAENRVQFDALSKKIPIAKKDQLIAHAVNPKDNSVALFLLRNGKQRVEIWSPKTREFKKTNIQGGYRTDQFDRFHLKVPMAWSPDGRFLLTMVFDNGFEKMTLLDVQSGKVSSIPYQPMVDRVLGFSWAPDENIVIASALKNGQVDLFYHKPGTNQFRQITNDGYDNLSPLYSPDGQFIYFSSNRDSINPKAKQLDYKTYRNFLDIFRLDLNDPEAVPEPVTRTDEVNEFPLRFSSSFELIAFTDEPGIFNLIKRNVFIGDVTRLTNINQGFYQVGLSDSLVVFSTPYRGKIQLFRATTEEMLKEHSLNITDLRFLKHLAWQQIMKREKDKGLSITQEPKDPEIVPVPSEETKEVKPDEEEEDTVKFYVFDEEEEEAPPKQTRKQKSRLPVPPKEVEKKKTLDFNDVVIDRPSKTKTKWTSDYISTMVGFSPAWFGHKYGTLFNVTLEGGFSDLEGNHSLVVGVRPFFFNLRNSDMYLKYAYLKHRLDFFGNIQQRTRYINTSFPYENDFLLRYYSMELNGGVTYPINRFASVSGRGHLNYVRRYDLDYMNPRGLDTTDIVPGVGANFLYDNTKVKDGFTTSGLKAEVDLFSTYSIGNAEMHFASLRMDVRHYQPIFKNLVFASRLVGGASIGNTPQRFYMGGVDNMLGRIQNGNELPLNSPNVSSFSYIDFITPMRGFLYNARNGTKYIAANAELRIPISRIITRSLNSSPIYNFELIPFFDIGTIWDQGNPLSQRNPINNDPIISHPLTINVQTLKSPFLIGFGSGVRFTLIGYSLRADLAWGMEDYSVLKPKIHLSLGKNF